MLSPLRNRFGIPGVIAVIALVFAMLGGAYAASTNGGGKATASAKGPRGPRGKTGKTGPQGPAGPAGAKGDTGAAGSNGKDGANGSNGPAGATGATGPTGKTGATGSNGTNGATGATGATGFSGFTATLPSGETETGSWSLFVGELELAIESMSFNIPLEEGLSGEDVHFNENETADCPGNASEPKAASGQLCVYRGQNQLSPVVTVYRNNVFTEGASASGAVLTGEGSPGGFSGGSWAVTAP